MSDKKRIIDYDDEFNELLDFFSVLEVVNSYVADIEMHSPQGITDATIQIFERPPTIGDPGRGVVFYPLHLLKYISFSDSKFQELVLDFFLNGPDEIHALRIENNNLSIVPFVGASDLKKDDSVVINEKG